MKNNNIVLTLMLAWGFSYMAFSQSPVNQTIQLTTTVNKSVPDISFRWDTVKGAVNFFIYRKAKAATSWGAKKATLPPTATGYTDSTIVVGADYEYKIYEI